MDDDDVREGLLESVAELQALVSGTLDFARADAGTEAMQKVHIRSLLHELAQRYALQNHAVPIQGNADVEWPCRPLALKRALTNLLENALRHAGSAQITVEQREALLEIQVQDSGPGIAESSLELVFEPFQQLETSRSAHRSGVGLGLSIARTCIELQGGTITLRNRPLKGLAAVIQLPGTPSLPAT